MDTAMAKRMQTMMLHLTYGAIQKTSLPDPELVMKMFSKKEDSDNEMAQSNEN